MMRGRLSWQTEPGTRSGCGAFTSPMAAACSAPTPLLCFVCVCDAGGGGVTHHPYVAGGRRQDTRGNDLGTRSRLSLSLSLSWPSLYPLGWVWTPQNYKLYIYKKKLCRFQGPLPCRLLPPTRPQKRPWFSFPEDRSGQKIE
jgi:hypothetical protein